MGTASKRAANPGAFGGKSWTKVISKDGTERVISVVRPNRGRSLWKSMRTRRKGFKPLKLGDIKVHKVDDDSSPSVTQKPGVIQKMKTAFQRKAK